MNIVYLCLFNSRYLVTGKQMGRSTFSSINAQLQCVCVGACVRVWVGACVCVGVHVCLRLHFLFGAMQRSGDLSGASEVASR